MLRSVMVLFEWLEGSPKFDYETTSYSSDLDSEEDFVLAFEQRFRPAFSPVSKNEIKVIAVVDKEKATGKRQRVAQRG